MPKAKFSQACKFSPPPKEFAGTLKAEFLRPLADAFRGSAVRIHSMLCFPSLAYEWGKMAEAIISRLYAQYGSGNALLNAIDGLQERIRESVFDMFAEVWVEREAAPEGTSHTRVDEITQRQMPITVSGVEAMLSSQIIMAWTMFETLAGDTWEEFANNRPDTLTKEVMRTKGAAGDQPKSVPLQILQKHGFDLRKKMGTLLRDRIRLDSRDKIAKAFDELFGSESLPSKTIRSPELAALDAMRNVLIHRNGKVDEDFVKLMSNNPLMSHYCENDTLDLDADITVRLTETAISSGLAILCWVDEWLAARGSIPFSQSAGMAV